MIFINFISDPYVITGITLIVGLLLKIFLDKSDKKEFFSFIGEALIITASIAIFIEIPHIRKVITDDIVGTLTSNQYLDRLSYKNHQEIIKHIVALKLQSSNDDPAVTSFADEFFDGLDNPKYISKIDDEFIFELTPDKKNIKYNRHVRENTTYYGEASLQESYNPLFEHTKYILRINGKECFKLTGSNINNPKEISTRIDSITCRFLPIPQQSNGYIFDIRLSAADKYRYDADIEIENSKIIHNTIYNEIIGADHAGKVTVNVKYPKESCNLSIFGTGKFAQEAIDVQKEHERVNDGTLVHSFNKGYGHESMLILNVNCSSKGRI
jgi:hypothetical protein